MRVSGGFGAQGFRGVRLRGLGLGMSLAKRTRRFKGHAKPEMGERKTKQQPSIHNGRSGRLIARGLSTKTRNLKNPDSRKHIKML